MDTFEIPELVYEYKPISGDNMNRMKIISKAGGCILALAVIFIASFSYDAECWILNAREVGGHIGQPATVCGYVSSIKFAHKSKGQSFFQNINAPSEPH